MKITKLEAENVKRIRAIQITPDGNMVVIGGKNDQGKSSTLDAIEMAFAGKRSIPSRPVREGEDSAYVICETEEYTVKRTFKPSGDSNVTVEGAEGAVFKKPQALLNKLVGDLSFDPLGFVHMDPPKQVEMLRKMGGVDFATFDTKRDELYEDRKGVNKDVKRLGVELEGMERFPEAPEEEVSVETLVEQIEKVQKSQSDLAERIAKAQLTAEAIKKLGASIDKKRRELEDMEARLKQAVANLEETQKQIATDQEAAVDITTIQEGLETSQETNRQVRANQDRLMVVAEIEDTKEKSKKITADIEAVDQQKRDAIAKAKLPVEGLSFDDNGVLLNGIPFDQAGTAAQIRVSMAMGIALNPKMRVLLIREGSMFDDDSLKLVAEMADEHDMQCWIEMVGEREGVSVVIEDGAVKK